MACWVRICRGCWWLRPSAELASSGWATDAEHPYATELVANWLHSLRLAAMAKSLTLKNLPEALHDRLAAAAKRHRRSLNNEAILCLEAGLRAAPPSEDRLEEIRALRQGLPVGTFDPAEIEGFKGEGRP